jgi:hypothetical protein
MSQTFRLTDEATSSRYRNLLEVVAMKTKFIAAALLAASAVMAAPAFASGYGPAPFYRPNVGAPASQRGESAQTLAAEQQQADDNAVAYGGVRSGDTQTGNRASNAPQSASGNNSGVFKGH